MKWSKNWVAAMMLVPGLFIASCGSGDGNSNSSDTITTQSPPPPDVNSSAPDNSNTGDSSSLGTSNATGTDANGKGITGSTPATGGTVGTTGNTASDSRVSGTTGTARQSTARRSSGRKYSRSYNRVTDNTVARSGIKTRTATGDDTTSSTTLTTTTPTGQTGDTTMNTTRQTGNTSQTGDTMVNNVGNNRTTLRDTTGEGIGDTSWRNRRTDTTIRSNTDTSLNSWNNNTGVSEFDSTKGNQGNISGNTGQNRTGNLADTTTPEGLDSSNAMSSPLAGMNFTPSGFVPAMVRSNYAEIQLARMAVRQGQSSDVKRIARQIESDHMIALRELQTMGNSLNVTTDTSSALNDARMSRHMDMLRNSTGAEFDRSWLHHMHMMHDQKVRTLEQAYSSNEIQSSDIRNWVNRNLPVLRRHRDMLAQIMNTNR